MPGKVILGGHFLIALLIFRFVLEFCEPINVKTVEIASLEMFSSQPKLFKIYLSDRYPTKEWVFSGVFEPTQERTIQSFTVKTDDEYFAKYMKVELLEHFGEEHFCPVTLFRVYGLAMDDGEDYPTHRGDTDNDSDDDYDLDTEEIDEGGGDVRNLFTKAKDTVLHLVKKVLNVEEVKQQDNIEAIANLTENELNGTSETLNLTVNGTSTQNVTGAMLPCVPEVRTGQSFEDQTPRGPSDEPKPPHPIIDTESKTATQPEDIPVVRKLGDDEQMPSGEQSQQDKPMVVLIESGGSDDLNFDVHQCFSCDLLNLSLCASENQQMGKFCSYATLMLAKTYAQSCFPPVVHKRRELPSVIPNLPVSEHSTTSTELIQTKFGDQLVTPHSTVELTDKADDIPHSSASSPVQSSATEKIQPSQTSSESHHLQSSSEGKSSASVDDKSDKVSESSGKPLIQPSKTEMLEQTSTKDVLTEISATKVIVSDSSTAAEQSVSAKSPGSDSVERNGEKIASTETVLEPSSLASVVVEETTVREDSSREVTPALPDDWKPGTQDIVGEKSAESEERETNGDEVTSTSQLQDVTSLVDGLSTEEISKSTVDPSLADQPLLPSVGSPGMEGKENETQVVVEPKGTRSDVNVQKDLGLIRIPAPMPVQKRETTLMRLSNKIKVLEQNVSLSSRFLQELSQRYKKQSEDMMKTLNKTMAKLNNLTKSSEQKDFEHGEQIQIMEGRIDNLTSLVNRLTNSLEILNQQVTERQMISTSIEILIIFVMMLFLYRRGKPTNQLSPEIRQLIEAMPTSPAPPAVVRRASISGPVTPSKKTETIGTTQNLLKYSSESALAMSDCPVVEPSAALFPANQQPKEGAKKKKKKKHKNLESKSLVENQSETGTDINSAGLLFGSPSRQSSATSMTSSSGTGLASASSSTTSLGSHDSGGQLEKKEIGELGIAQNNFLKKKPPCLQNRKNKSSPDVQRKMDKSCLTGKGDKSGQTGKGDKTGQTMKIHKRNGSFPQKFEATLSPIKDCQNQNENMSCSSLNKSAIKKCVSFPQHPNHLNGAKVNSVKGKRYSSPQLGTTGHQHSEEIPWFPEDRIPPDKYWPPDVMSQENYDVMSYPVYNQNGYYDETDYRSGQEYFCDTDYTNNCAASAAESDGTKLPSGGWRKWFGLIK